MATEYVRGPGRGTEPVQGYTRAKPERPGRSAMVPEKLAEEMARLRVDGESFSDIAAEMNRRGKATPTGKTWSFPTVKSALQQWALAKYIREERARQGKAPAAPDDAEVDDAEG